MPVAESSRTAPSERQEEWFDERVAGHPTKVSEGGVIFVPRDRYSNKSTEQATRSRGRGANDRDLTKVAGYRKDSR